MADISGNTWAALDVVKCKLSDSWVELEEEGQRLADTTTGTEDDDLGELETSSCKLSMAS